MEKKASLPSDVIGTLPPLCPSDIARHQNLKKLDDESVIETSITDAVPSSAKRHYKKKEGADDSDITGSTLLDTIHYLSPVSPLSARSVYEGDVDYVKLLKQHHAYVEEASSYTSSTVSCVETELQRTVAIVKPEAMEYQDVIVRAINEAGFSTVDKRVIHFTPEQVSEFFCQYYGSPSFPHQVVSMSVGPALVLSLADTCAVSKWRDMVGPDKILREEWFYPMSMRVRFGIQDSMPNAMHASENLADAFKENRYVFPKNILEPIINDRDKVNDYCALYINPTLLDGLAELVKIKPIDPIIFLAEWLLLHDPYQPKLSKDEGLLPT